MAWLTPLPAVDGHRRYALASPVDGADLGELVVTTPDEVRAAIARARAAQPAWAALGTKERARIVQRAIPLLLARKQAYLDRMTAETGRPALDTLMIEMFSALDVLNYYSRNAPRVLADHGVGLHLLRMKKAKLTYQPLGVVGVISPWNGPFILSLNPAVQALLAGNAVVIKPSEVTPISGQLVAELLHDAGVPRDVLQVVLGDGETGAALVEGGLDKVTFTGSVRTGRRVGEACGRNLVPCTLELGGKDPMIVCADADLDRAAGGAVFGGIMNTGQFCSSTERIYVVASVAQGFLDRLAAKVRELQVGRDVGPFIHAPQIDIVERHVAEAVKAGARVLVGGQREGRCYAPTLIVDVPHDAALMQEETFGPVLPVTIVKDEEEAIRLANACEFGLGASVWSKDVARAEAIARRLIVGAVTLNDSSITYGALEVPFGGRKSSGVGRTNGAEALRSYTHPMPILRDRFGAKDEAVWYPYTPEKFEKLWKALDVMWGTPLRWFLS